MCDNDNSNNELKFSWLPKTAGVGTAVCSSHWLRNLGRESSISEEALEGGVGGERGVKTARGRGGTSPASNAAATSDLRSHTDSSTYVHPLPTPCPGTGNGQTEVSKKARSGPCRERPLALSSRGRVGRVSWWRDKHSQIWRSLSLGQD